MEKQCEKVARALALERKSKGHKEQHGDIASEEKWQMKILFRPFRAEIVSVSSFYNAIH